MASQQQQQVNLNMLLAALQQNGDGNLGSLTTLIANNQEELSHVMPPLAEFNEDVEVAAAETINDAVFGDEEEEENQHLTYDPEVLIDLIKGEPCIWDTACRAYKEQNKKKNAWDKISKIFDKDGKLNFKFSSYSYM